MASCRIAFAAALGGLTTTSLLGQQAEEEVFTLNPFVVDASDDVGYASSNSTSATRLNERIKVLPISIEAINSDLMNDLAITDVTEALSVAAGVVVEDDSNQRSTTFRGLTSRFQRRNQFVWYNPTDNFSTERVEVIRGPQSLLYGQAEPGGLVNTITKRGIYGNSFQKLQTRVDDDGGSRATIDLNFGELIPEDKLAIRIAGLAEDGESWRIHEDRDKEGIFLAAGAKLLQNLEFRLEFEDAEIDEKALTGNIEDFQIVGQDSVEIIDAVHQGQALYGNLINKDELGSWNGLDNQRLRSWQNKAAFLEGSFLDGSLSYQLAWNEQTQRQDIHRVYGGDDIDFGVYQYDSTDVFPIGAGTPNDLGGGLFEFGEDYYVTLGRQWETNGNTVTNKRATVSYTFEPFETKHTLIAGFDTRTDYFYITTEDEIGANGDAIEYYVPVRQGGSGFSVASDLESARASGTRTLATDFANEEHTDAMFVALSSKFFDEKLHTLIGWRNDDFEKWQGLATAPIDLEGSTVDADKVDSYNFGANYSFNYQWSVYANYSESFKASGASRLTPYGDTLQAAFGEGKEVGVKWDSEDNRYSGTLSYYQADFTGDQVRLGNEERDAISPVRGPGLTGGQARNLGGRPGGWRWITADTQSEGLEFQMNAAPTENWNFRVSYAYIIDAGLAQDFGMQAIYNDHFLVGPDGNPVAANGSPLIFQGQPVTIDDVEFSEDGRYVLNSNILRLVATPEREYEGGSPVNPYTGQTMPFILLGETGDQNSYSKQSFNLTAKYKVTEGRFKGINIGGNLRSRIDNLAGYEGAVGDTDRMLRYNPDYTTVDLFVNYWKKLGNVGWSTQLNINNVLDEEYFGSSYKGFYYPGRTFIWSNNFNF